MEQGEAERRDDRRRPEVALDPLEDRAQGGQLAGGVEVEQLIGQALATLQDRETVAQALPELGALLVQGAAEVRGVERGLALLAPAELVPADGAAIVLADRSGSRGPAVGIG